ncbi:hypothetical protein Leucomu_10825 [Leucobacter muris]|uniref:Uncharacterized protein n=1 Tax=Leucobacter muris TaxID=1935379 RepID=A0ABX5QH98_9MICO|nr:hypothetical protein [Leucobacter muris]QAB18346.1 hypothetical protein Leucomu_10825 [Leucobacter muris]
MLYATIRLAETHQVTVEGESLGEIQQHLREQCPDGFVLTLAPVSMAKASMAITATGTYERRDKVQEIEAPSYAELRAAVPEGWQMLSVRRV